MTERQLAAIQRAMELVAVIDQVCRAEGEIRRGGEPVTKIEAIDHVNKQLYDVLFALRWPDIARDAARRRAA